MCMAFMMTPILLLQKIHKSVFFVILIFEDLIGKKLKSSKKKRNVLILGA